MKGKVAGQRDARLDEAKTEDGVYRNVMFDSHVTRGKAYNSAFRIAKHIIEAKKAQPKSFDPERLEKIARQTCASTMTDPIFEDLSVGVQTHEEGVQTEPMLFDPPGLPKPAASNHLRNFSTQVDAAEPLIDFDAVVEGAVVAISNAVLEQSRMEVLEEQELARMEAQRNAYNRQKFALEVELQRLRKSEGRAEVERSSRQEQVRAGSVLLTGAHCKLTARVCARQFVSKRASKVITAMLDAQEWFAVSSHDLHRRFGDSLLAQATHLVLRRQMAVEAAHSLLHQSQARALALTHVDANVRPLAERVLEEHLRAKKAASEALQAHRREETTQEEQRKAQSRALAAFRKSVALRVSQLAKPSVLCAFSTEDDQCPMGYSPLQVLCTFMRLEEDSGLSILQPLMVELATAGVKIQLDVPLEAPYATLEEAAQAAKEDPLALTKLSEAVAELLGPEQNEATQVCEELLHHASRMVSIGKSPSVTVRTVLPKPAHPTPVVVAQGGLSEAARAELRTAEERKRRQAYFGVKSEATSELNALFLQRLSEENTLWAVKHEESTAVAVLNNVVWLAQRLEAAHFRLHPDNEAAESLAQRLLRALAEQPCFSALELDGLVRVDAPEL